eukprot:Hpha_TRINITY_DN3274_c0_g1::TRINITY_DN3274_c0_g1_i1::g.186069::m.186069/K15272/SLC35A1_2_3; solute carrier family 35 (UDP-sugar transporter), member A1/2/3
MGGSRGSGGGYDVEDTPTHSGRDREVTQAVSGAQLQTVTSESPVKLGRDGDEEKKGHAPAGSCGGYSMLAWMSLATLVAQNSTLTLTMRASRLGDSKQMYLASSAVVTCEALKVVSSMVLLVLETGSWRGMVNTVRNDIFKEPLNNVPVLVPAGMYVLQNNLQYVAASNLDPAVFQVLYQTKLVTTALMYVIVMRKSLAPLQWLAVVLLTTGVILVQLATQGQGGGLRRPGESTAVGCAAVFVACLTSAGAGLYLEFIVKFTRSSVWIRNMQMGALGLVLGMVAGYWKDWQSIREDGFFVGFNGLVWAVVLLQSAGGLLTAVVVKYADNVIKGFATGLAIIVSCLFSAVFFGFVITSQYVLGAAVVVSSVFLYSLHQPFERWLNRSIGKPTPCRVATAAMGLAMVVVWHYFRPMSIRH